MFKLTILTGSFMRNGRSTMLHLFLLVIQCRAFNAVRSIVVRSMLLAMKSVNPYGILSSVVSVKTILLDNVFRL